MSITVSASAEVTITFELKNLGTWGEECKLDQIINQAKTAARARGHKMLAPGTTGTVTVQNVILTELR